MADRLKFVVIEDEAPIRRFLMACWTAEEAEWVEAETAAKGITAVARSAPDLVLLDLGLPDRDGLEVVREIRQWSEVPIIILSARGREKDKVAALDLGADDYVTKPFAVGELMARVRVALRRRALHRPTPEPVISSGDLRIDVEGHQVFLGEEEVRLTPTEFRLLVLLGQHAGKVVTHRQLLSEIWGEAFTDSTHTLRVHMAALRQKLERDPARPEFIRTETGVGYRFMAD
jgi:two-component system KDP operon response regulator KdpE